MKRIFFFPLVIASVALGDPPKGLSFPTELKDVLVTAGWSCKYTSKYVLSEGSEKAPKSLPIACVARVRCEKEDGSFRGYTIACTSPAAETCPSIADCDAEDRKKDAKTLFKAGELSDKAENRGETDKHGRKCSYIVPTSSAVHRFVDKVEDVVCASSLRCDRDDVGPRRSVVFCQALSTREVDGKLKATCPRVNDCIANEIVPRIGYTAEELRALRASGGIQPKSSEVPLTHPER